MGSVQIGCFWIESLWIISDSKNTFGYTVFSRDLGTYLRISLKFGPCLSLLNYLFCMINDIYGYK